MTARFVEKLLFFCFYFSNHILLKRLYFYHTVKHLSVLHCAKYSFLFIVLLDTFGSTSLYHCTEHSYIFVVLLDTFWSYIILQHHLLFIAHIRIKVQQHIHDVIMLPYTHFASLTCKKSTKLG